MATYSAFSSTPPASFGATRSPGNVGLRPPLPTIGSAVAPVGQRTGSFPLTLPTPPAYTTYYYRTSGGSRGNTTSIGSIPAGAVLLYQVFTQP
jgi:hypothetical protein